MLHPKPKYKRHKRRAKRTKQAQLDCVARDGMCKWCGRIDDTLVGHHFDSFGAHGSDDLMSMVTLCGRCHDTVHHGYLLLAFCNHPEILAAQPGLRGVSSLSPGGAKLWDADNVLKGIVEGEYGHD